MKEKIKSYFKKSFPFGLMMYQYLGLRIALLWLMSILVGSLDAIGITSIIPLLKIVDGGSSPAKPDKMTSLFRRFFETLGVEFSLVSVLLFMMSLFAMKGLIKFLQGYYKFTLRASFVRLLRENFIRDFLRYDYQKYVSLNAGKISNLLTQEAMAISGAFVFYNNAVISLFTICAYLTFALYANVSFTLIAISAGGLISLLMKRVSLNTKKMSTNLAGSNTEFSGLLSQTVHYFKYLKTTGVFIKMEKKILANTKVLERDMKNIGRNMAFSTSIREPLSIVIIFSIIIFQVKVMSVNIVGIIAALLVFYRALSEILNYQNNWQTFIGSYGSIASVMELKKDFSKHKERKTSDISPVFSSSIKFKNVSFSYENSEKKIVDNISLEIHKNKTIAFVGESGAGKTTVVDLLTGILKPTGGQILIDDKPMTGINIFEWRKKIGYITQESVIFNDTVLNNISLWDVYEKDENEVLDKTRDAVSHANSQQFVESMEQGYETKLGDRGVNLSGGQKQRLSIARELYKNVEILILDEATSALDSESENIIKNNINSLMGQKTILMIAHRLSTIKNADEIFVLGGGGIIEHGSYDLLMNNPDSRLNKMVQLQSL